MVDSFVSNTLVSILLMYSLPIISQYHFKTNITLTMKKPRESKDVRRPTQPFFKYVPQKAHCRSLMQLQPNPRYQQSARQPTHNKENHHSSLCNHSETEIETVKSNSLKKFLSLFGGNASSGGVMSSMGAKASSREEKQTGRSTGRQVFTCNIKNMNVNMGGSKGKDQTVQNKSFLIVKREKGEVKIDRQQQVISSLKKDLEECRGREQELKRKMEQLQRDNHFLRADLRKQTEQRQTMEKKYSLRQLEQQRRIESLQRNMGKERCRQHELVIESLKKVINEQLRKIIELEKSKIEREEIEKLEERINLNASIKNDSLTKDKLRFLQSSELVRMRRKEGAQIKIEDEPSFQESLGSELGNTKEVYEEAIEQVTEEQQNESLSRVMSDGDSILQQVDKYLALWRNKH